MFSDAELSLFKVGPKHLGVTAGERFHICCFCVHFHSFQQNLHMTRFELILSVQSQMLQKSFGSQDARRWYPDMPN